MNNAILREKLQSRIISPRVLLSNSKFLNEELRNTIAFSDPMNLPFFYHLGKQLNVEHVLQIGAQGSSGYIGPCFLHGCNFVKSYTIIDQIFSENASMSSFVRSNMRRGANGTSDVVVGAWDTVLKRRKQLGVDWDLVIVSQSCIQSELNKCLNYAWDNLKEEGLLVVDYISKNCPVTAPDLNGAFLKFCRVKNREPVIFETRYGTGVVTR